MSATSTHTHSRTGADAMRRGAPRHPAARLHGRALMAARAAWLAVAALTLGQYAASIWAGLRGLQDPCPRTLCLDGRVPAGIRDAFASLHLSVSFLAGYTLALNIVFFMVFAAVGALIFWRQSRDPLALFVSLTLLIFGAGAFEGDMLPLQVAYPSAWLVPVSLLDFLGVAAFGIFLCVFPDGRFVPRWTLLLAVAWALWMLPTYLFPDSPYDFNTWPAVASLGMWALFLSTFVFAQVYRYRRVSTPEQRVKSKWVVLGLTAAAVGHFGGMLLRAFQPPWPTSSGALLGILAADTLMYASVLLIPLGVGIAMLRYHLFDVDLLIQWTLVYSALGATLALVYEGGVIVAQKVVLALTGETSFMAEVLAAFGAGALSRRVHHRLDRGITRVFYPRKYEAERRVDDFARQVHRELGTEPVHEMRKKASPNVPRPMSAECDGPGELPPGTPQPLVLQQGELSWALPPHPLPPP